MAVYQFDERAYLTADGARLVKRGDKDAATLFAIPGDAITHEEAIRFGLVEPEAPVRRPARKGEEEEEPAKVEEKHIPGPPEDKAMHKEASK